jgi:UDP-glucose:(heptosyl)LPS alpha-1,3-glucosyltransferase
MKQYLKFIRANKTKFGGAENYLSRLSVELNKENISHEIISSNLPKFLSSWIKALLFNLQVCKNKKNTFYFSLDRIACADIYRAGDGVHKEFLKTKKRKLNPLNSVYLYLEKKCFINSKKIIANSNMIKNQIIETYNIEPSKISVVYNGINIKEINYKKSLEKLSNEFGISKEKKIILFVGSGFERKGANEFMQILSKLKAKNYHAFIVGKEKKLNYYKELANSLHVNDFITFTGPRSDVDDFYTISDIFLFPTTYEPFSNVILEAMSFKNAVFTTKQNGAHEILKDEYILETPEDFTIINKIDELLDNEEKLNSVKKENFKTVQNFTIEKNAKETMEIINEYLY